MRLFLVSIEYPYQKVATQPGCIKTAWKWKTTGPYPVAATRATEAANLFLEHLEECGCVPKNVASSRLWVCEHVWDGKRGFKIAANTDGDIQYDVRREGDNWFARMSENSFAGDDND